MLLYTWQLEHPFKLVNQNKILHWASRTLLTLASWVGRALIYSGKQKTFTVKQNCTVPIPHPPASFLLPAVPEPPPSILPPNGPLLQAPAPRPVSEAPLIDFSSGAATAQPASLAPSVANFKVLSVLAAGQGSQWVLAGWRCCQSGQLDWRGELGEAWHHPGEEAAVSSWAGNYFCDAWGIQNLKQGFPSVRQAQGTPLDSETGWTWELWLKTYLLEWQN